MKQKLITDFFDNSENKKIKLDKSNSLEEIIRGYNLQTDSWHCVECGIDMGKNNSRQLCNKTYCGNSF